MTSDMLPKAKKSRLEGKLDKSVKSKNLKQSFFDEKETYLCTGMDVFLNKEPCVMCSMALLHSRVRRVFYDESNPECGGLGSIRRIHCNKKLNHSFQVFRGQ